MKTCNMILEDVIESLNKYVESRRYNDEKCAKAIEHFVLHKSITPAPTFKAYKVLEYTLWVVKGSDKYRFFTKKLTVKIPTDYEELVIKDFEMGFLTDLFKVLFDTKSLNNKDRTILEDVIYGEYLSHCNE